jgi:LuxR family maltose regulon positive regulatory protein
VLLAPAGYGKTTATVAALIESGSDDAAWLSIDAYDSTELSFWAHLAAAIDGVRPGILRMLAESSERAFGLGGSQMAASLVSALDADGELTLVFDDLHRLKSNALWEQLTYFLERLPLGVRVIAMTRSMPSLPVERWQIEGRAVVVDEQTLRFNVSEAAGLVEGLGEGNASPDEIAELVSRSEGWAVGLLFEAITQQSQNDPESPVAQADKRPSRTVINYLAREVLNELKVEDREFLLSISVLDEFDNGLCRQITGESDAGLRLRSLQVAHLFLVPVDERAERFRFHHLFRDLLLGELESRDPGRLIELHRCAAEAARANGDFPGQIHHLIDAGDRVEAFDAMVQLHAAQAGSVASARELVARFPNEFILEDPHRMLEYSFIYVSAGDFEMADQWCDRAEAALDEDDALRARLDFQRFIIHGGRGETQAALDALDRSLQMGGRNPLDDLTTARLTAPMAARIHILRRDSQAASLWLEKARHSSRQFDHIHHETIPALSAFIQFFAGDLKGAERLARQSLSAGEHLATPPGILALEALLVLSDVLVESGRLDEAASVLDRAEVIATQLAPPAYLVAYALARVELTAATQGPAPAVVQAALAVTRFKGRYLGADLTNLLVAKHSYWLLADGRTSEASRLSETLPLGPFRSILRAKLAILAGREHEVTRILAGSHDWPAPERIEAELVCDAATNFTNLSEILERADGFTWTVIKQGEDLLGQLAAISGDPGRSNHAVAHVLEAAAAFDVTYRTGERGVVTGGPLTDREDALLRLLSSHLSYAEIAAESFISVNTVKSNLKTVYRKLGVSSRSEAVQRARDLNLC